MTRILVGIDGSERGERALEWAARRAERDGASLTLLSVVDPAVAREAGVDTETMKRASQETVDAAAAKLAAGHPGVKATTSVVEGKTSSR